MKTILVVEDQSEVQELVRATLGGGDYRVLTADNGEQALAAALAERPDLILMDVMMPGAVDGLEATRRIKAQLGDACRVVMLSARGQEADRRAGSEAGADAYFVKPFSPLELLRTVEALVG